MDNMNIWIMSNFIIDNYKFINSFYFWNFKGFMNNGFIKDFFLVFRIKFIFYCFFNFFDNFIDNVMLMNFDIISICLLMSLWSRVYVKFYNNSIWCFSKCYIRFINSINCWVNNVNFYFFNINFKERSCKCFYRILYISFDNNINWFNFISFKGIK